MVGIFIKKSNQNLVIDKPVGETSVEFDITITAPYGAIIKDYIKQLKAV